MTSAERTVLMAPCMAARFTPGPNTPLSTALGGALLRQWLTDANHGGRRLHRFNCSMAAILALTTAWMARY